jgi:hypothetical protein
MTVHSNIIATDTNDHAAGTITYWRLSSTDQIQAQDLSDALARKDADDNAPRPPSPKTALRRAVAAQATGGKRFVRKGVNSILLVEQDGDDFEVILTATVNVVGQPEVDATDSVNDLMAATVKQDYWQHLDQLSSTDISSWLIREAVECDAISLRDTGGVYFVPSHKLDRWEQICDALHEVSSCRVHRIPAMSTDDAVESILTALTEECKTFSEEMDAALGDSDLGARAMRGRADKADKMLAKLTRYEALLGDKMSDIAAQIQEQQANAIMVALTKEGE